MGSAIGAMTRANSDKIKMPKNEIPSSATSRDEGKKHEKKEVQKLDAVKASVSYRQEREECEGAVDARRAQPREWR